MSEERDRTAERFLRCVEDLRSLAVIGLSKNAGKTTAVNALVSVWPPGRPLCLTSVGYDGEALDHAWGHTKPRLFLPVGTLFITARRLFLAADLDAEILDTLDVETAFGDLVLARVRLAGFVELAGPPTAATLPLAEAAARSFAPDLLFLIDGALSRRRSASPAYSAGVILCVEAGAQTPAELAAQVVHALSLLCAEAVPAPWNEAILALEEDVRLALFDSQGSLVFASQARSLSLAIGAYLESGLVGDFLYLDGALTARLLDRLFVPAARQGLRVAVADGTQLFLPARTRRRLGAAGLRLYVHNPVDLRAVVFNPRRADGHLVAAEDYLQALEAVLEPPVFTFSELDPARGWAR